MTLDELLPNLDGVQQRGTRWAARCPAHADRSPSLSLTVGERGILLKCWAGCTLPEICESLGVQQKDLFFDAPAPHGCRPTPKPTKINRTAFAFRFELAALDLRLRADNVLKAVKNITSNELPDHDLDRLVNAVGRAYADIERAELFEGVSDDLREKAFAQKEGTVNYAA